MLPTDVLQLLADFAEAEGRPAAVLVIHPADWEELSGWHGTGTYGVWTCRSGLSVAIEDGRRLAVRRSSDVERGLPELY